MSRAAMQFAALVATLFLTFPCVVPPAQAQSGGRTQLLTPVPLAAAAQGAELFVLNGVEDPVSGTIELLSAAGETLRRLPFEVPTSDHRSFDLEGLHRGAPVASIRVSHDGGTDGLQAWLVLRRGHQAVELGLESPAVSSRSTLGAFWDLSGRADGAHPVFYLLNTTDSAVDFEVLSSEPGRRSGGTIPALGVEIVRPFAARSSGWLEIRHHGSDGAILGQGIVTGPGDLSVSSLDAPSNAPSTSYVSIRVPVVEADAPLRPDTHVSLFNGAEEASSVSIEVFDAPTGDLLHRFERTLAPREITSLELAALLGRATAPTGDEVRIRVTSDRPGLRVDGFTRLSSGAVLDLAFFDESTAHGSGHYPLLSLQEYNLFLTVINLGTQRAEVVAQLFWDDGWTYSYGPVPVEPGASRRIDVRQLAEEATPDMMGRTLDAGYGGGMLKWKVFEGEPKFVARTEARPLDTADTFGFNCWGCCWEEPMGSIVPSDVSFFLNQSPLFEAGVTWGTCSGTMGPYPTTPSQMVVPSPFSWNATSVSATDTAKETLYFEAFKEKVTATCKYFLKKITGFGGASTCKHLLRRPDNPAQTWKATQTCTSQVGGTSNPCTLCQACCDQILSYKICSKVALTTANNEHQACLVNCATDVCN